MNLSMFERQTDYRITAKKAVRDIMRSSSPDNNVSVPGQNELLAIPRKQDRIDGGKSCPNSQVVCWTEIRWSSKSSLTTPRKYYLYLHFILFYCLINQGTKRHVIIHGNTLTWRLGIESNPLGKLLHPKKHITLFPFAAQQLLPLMREFWEVTD